MKGQIDGQTLRIEFAGALSHLTTRGNARQAIFRSGHYTLQQVGDHFGVSYATVSRAVKMFENNL